MKQPYTCPKCNKMSLLIVYIITGFHPNFQMALAIVALNFHQEHFLYQLTTEEEEAAVLLLIRTRYQGWGFLWTKVNILCHLEHRLCRELWLPMYDTLEYSLVNSQLYPLKRG
ncbi:unnamed protein product [Meganyctiphanes norvegica]|uniref:Uncharacterized protein n=1 Tax=Meganyctiphanes norvegica TaxID=48144 RepID=A0AAV2SW05_MEGNR